MAEVTMEETIAKLASDDKMTFGETLGPAMEITDQEQANTYYDLLVDRHVRLYGNAKGEAETLVKSNLGYYAGYYSREVMQRVNKLFMTSHPIFGNVPPTAEEAFAKGLELGKAATKV